MYLHSTYLIIQAPLEYLESCAHAGISGLYLSEKMRRIPEEDSLEKGLNNYALFMGQVEGVCDSVSKSETKLGGMEFPYEYKRMDQCLSR